MLRPPPAVLLAYRFFGWRVGPTYSDWVHDDLMRRGWIIRQGTPGLSVILILGAVIGSVSSGRDTSHVLAAIAVLALGGIGLRRSLRDRALRQQGIDADGNPLGLRWYTDDQERVRRNILSTVGTGVMVLAALALLANN